MPSFDITSETDFVALKNAVDVAGRHIGNRYDFKGTSAKAELNEKDKLITIWGDSEFQLGQVKDILFPEMEKKELKIKTGIEQELAKKIVKLVKDSKLKVQATIQGDAVRVTGAKRDVLQEAIALVKKTVTDYPLTYGNFRD